MGANSAHGFVSLFPELSCRVFSVKGSSGSGKSTFIKTFERENCDKIYCSGDISSLDGIIFGDTAIVDGTAPHITEPTNGGGYIVMPQKPVFLPDYARIKSLIRTEYDEGYKLLSGVLFAEKAASPEIDKKAAAHRGAKLAEKFKKGQKGREIRRFSDGICAEGFVFLDFPGCEKIAVVCDETNAQSFFSAMRTVFLNENRAFITCLSPLEPANIRHILLPDLQIAFTLRDGFSPDKEAPSRGIHLHPLSKKTERQKLFSRLSRELFKEACSHFAKAKEYHRELEELYRPSLDIPALSRLAKKYREII